MRSMNSTFCGSGLKAILVVSGTDPERDFPTDAEPPESREVLSSDAAAGELKKNKIHCMGTHN